MALIPEHLWAQMTDDEQRLVKETIQGLRSHGNAIVCPECGATLHVSAQVRLTCVESRDPTPEKAADNSSAEPGDTSGERLLDLARQNGMLDAFVAALRAEKLSQMPGDPDGFFLRFLRSFRPLSAPIPKDRIAFWREEFGGRVEVVQWEGIIGVLSDKVLRAFVPNRFCRAPLAAKGRIRLDTQGAWETWRKGRFGYVPQGGVFAEMLQQANLGKFCNPVQ